MLDIEEVVVFIKKNFGHDSFIAVNAVANGFILQMPVGIAVNASTIDMMREFLKKYDYELTKILWHKERNNMVMNFQRIVEEDD